MLVLLLQKINWCLFHRKCSFLYDFSTSTNLYNNNESFFFFLFFFCEFSKLSTYLTVSICSNNNVYCVCNESYVSNTKITEKGLERWHTLHYILCFYAFFSTNIIQCKHLIYCTYTFSIIIIIIFSHDQISRYYFRNENEQQQQRLNDIFYKIVWNCYWIIIIVFWSVVQHCIIQ